MNSTKNNSSAKEPKKAQLEEFDLVILGGGTGSTLAAWTFAGQGKRVAVIEPNTLADRARISPVCPART
jgi:glycerol-3-phosphate dehydrogenase